MNKVISILILLCFATGYAQQENVATITEVNYSCPDGITVTYDLVCDQPVDITLKYRGKGCPWSEAITVTGNTGQSTGTGKIIIWNNIADHVVWGKFYFKLEVPQSDCDASDCVMINGVCWAKTNLDVGGVFCANQEDYGALYQWGRKSDGHESRSPLSPTIAGPASGVNLDSDGQPIGSFIGKFITNSSNPYDWRTPQKDDLWNALGAGTPPEKTDNDPCPCGWRVPTKAELDALGTWADQSKVTKEPICDGTCNGYNLKGMLLTDKATNASLFLPAAGHRYANDGTLNNAGTNGLYWSSTPIGSSAYNLGFNSGYFSVSYNGRAAGFSVRCVAE